MTDKGSTENAVKVTIYGQEYPIRSRGNVEYIRKVARYVDEQMYQIEEQTSVKSPSRLAILAALNIADKLFELQDDKDQLLSDFEAKAREISEYLNRGINEV